MNEVIDFFREPWTFEFMRRGLLAAVATPLLAALAAWLPARRALRLWRQEEAPLMEAVQLMVVDSLINIPVLKEGNLVGILTDRNLLLEICHLATGGN